jgi:predicted ATPase
LFSFRLENVKAFVDTGFIEIKPINIFVGKNSSGKSSLIRFPVMLSQTFSEDVFTPFLFFGKQIDYGNFDDVVHNRGGDVVSFSFRFDKKHILRMTPVILARSLPMDNFKKIVNTYEQYTIKVSIMKQNKKIIVKEFILSLDGKDFVNVQRDKNNKYEFIIYQKIIDDRFVDLPNPISLFPDIIFNKFFPFVDVKPGELTKKVLNAIDKKGLHLSLGDEQLETLLDRLENERYERFNSVLNNHLLLNDDYIDIFTKTYDTTVTIRFFNVIIRIINSIMNNFANTISYIGPFRKDPERIYRDSESSFVDVGKNGENASMILRQAQQGKTDLLDKVSNWFYKSMGYKIYIEEIENSNLFKLMVSGNNIIDVGYGIAQVLPIVTQIYYENTIDIEIRRSIDRFGRRKTFIIEQPELHLHPAAQSSLADLFVEKVISSRGCSFLIETHSEHFIRKLQILVANPEVNISSEDIAIYYVDKLDEGYSTIKRLKMNEKGQFIDKWPSGFFDQSFELSRELLRVASMGESK